ncbi:MAG: OmpA family protein [Bacteroidota bacterium]
MYRSIASLLALSFCLSFSLAQNLVPNPGFEANEKIVPTWMRNDLMFEAMTIGWTSPNQGSPDIIANAAIPRWHPKRRRVDLSTHKARNGEVMMGIKTYGCATGTQHCKEYLQIELEESLDQGQEYYAEFWVQPIRTSIRVNNFGMALSDVEIQDNDTYGIHYFDPVVEDDRLIDAAPGEWVRISGVFTADFPYQYLLIGNFRTDDETLTRSIAEGLRYSYYLIDDVLLRPVGKSFSVSLRTEEFEKGEAITLDNIFFAHDESELLPASFPQLDELVRVLQEQSELSIKVCGHTDNSGQAEYNLVLSEKRAAAVADYLAQKGISKKRLQLQGFGDSQPVADNDTEEGRQANRRVTFVVQ